MFSVSVRISLFALAWLSRVNVAQEPWRGHACNGLGSNKWHYSSFVSIRLSAKCIPARPRTTPSSPRVVDTPSYSGRPGFKSRPGDRIFRLFVVFLSLSR
jgi:hypothetical protein